MKLPARVFWIHAVTGTTVSQETEVDVLFDRPGMIGLETTHGEYGPKYIDVGQLVREIARRAVPVPAATEPEGTDS